MNDPHPEPQQQARWPACLHCPYRVTASQPCCCGTDPEDADDGEQPSLLARLLVASAIAALLGG